MNSKKVIVRPGAPALDKGLDLIEALAAESGTISCFQFDWRRASTAAS